MGLLKSWKRKYTSYEVTVGKVQGQEGYWVHQTFAGGTEPRGNKAFFTGSMINKDRIENHFFKYY